MKLHAEENIDRLVTTAKELSASKQDITALIYSKPNIVLDYYTFYGSTRLRYKLQEIKYNVSTELLSLLSMLVSQPNTSKAA